MKTCLVFAILVAVQVLFVGSSGAQAQGTAYEGFEIDRVGQELLEHGSGDGFRDVWEVGGFNAQTHDNFKIAAGSLAFPGLLTRGNHIKTTAQDGISGITRYFPKPLGQTPATYYLSFLIQPDGTLGEGAWNGFFGLLLEQPQDPELFIGKPGEGASARYVLEERGNPGQVSSNKLAKVGETTLMVVKLQFVDGPDRFTLYIDPQPGQPEPVDNGLLKVGGDLTNVTGITLYATGAYALDEIRLGPDFAAVVPVEQPAEPAAQK